MTNPAPAIFPPPGVGDARPANQAVLDWVHEIATLTEPENIFWCDGSERENEFLIAESLKQNVLIKLNQKRVPHSYLHRSDPNDVVKAVAIHGRCATRPFVSLRPAGLDERDAEAGGPDFLAVTFG